VDKPRRFQFSLRKLFLWTAVVALYFGCGEAICLSLGEEAAGPLVLLAVWIGVLGLVRTAFGSQAAVLFSMGVAATLSGIAGYIVQANVSPYRERAIFGIATGCVVGFCLFAITELLIRAVDWLDRLMERRAHRD